MASVGAPQKAEDIVVLRRVPFKVYAKLVDAPEKLDALVAIVRTHEAGGPASDDMAALLLRVHSYSA